MTETYGVNSTKWPCVPPKKTTTTKTILKKLYNSRGGFLTDAKYQHREIIDQANILWWNKENDS